MDCNWSSLESERETERDDDDDKAFNIFGVPSY